MDLILVVFNFCLINKSSSYSVVYNLLESTPLPSSSQTQIIGFESLNMDSIKRIFGSRTALIGLTATVAAAGTTFYLLIHIHRGGEQHTSPIADAAIDETNDNINSNANDEKNFDDESDDEELEPFLPVMAGLDQDALKCLAIETRLSQLLKSSKNNDSDLTCDTGQSQPVAATIWRTSLHSPMGLGWLHTFLAMARIPESWSGRSWTMSIT
jgi:hypothetical protein